MKRFKVYKITCLITNKIYVGQTYQTLEQRLQEHLSSSKSKDTKFYRAIRKYGQENFVIELLEDCDTQEELDLLEYKWICYYNACELGYNTKNSIGKCGGDTLTNHPNIEEIKTKISNSKKGILNPHHTEIKAYNVVTGEELFFSTIKEAQDYFSLEHHSVISKRVRKVTKIVWNNWTFAYVDEDYEYTTSVINSRSRAVRVVDTWTNESKDFETLTAAEQHYDFRCKAISYKLNGKNPHTLYKNRYLFQVLQ